MRLIGALLMLLVIGLSAARADEFELPGVAADARTYERQLQAHAPAGATARARTAADQAVTAARQRHDDPALLAALQQRAGLGEVSRPTWQALAEALLRTDPKHALLAAWLAFGQADSEVDAEIPALLVMADALRAQMLDAQAVQALEEVVRRAPDDPAYKRRLADAQRAAGLAVRRVAIEGEADPPRGCIAFSVPPSRRADFDPQDWVRLDPPVPGAAVTREGDQICISGLPSGAVTRATLRAGLPAEPRDAAAALTLQRDAVVPLDVPNRQPRALFDTRRFVLPRGQAPSVGLTTVNLSAVALKLVRLSERNVAAFLRERRLGDAVDPSEARYAGEQDGRVVWQGRADIPNWQPNRPTHTALPLPPPLLTAGAGLYALIVAAGDGTRDDTAGAVQVILRTDLAPTVWRGSDGLTVQIRGYADAGVRPGVALRLLARNNDILAEATTDADGVARFAAPLLHGEGPLAPALLEAFGPEDDYAALDLNAAAFDLSDRGVGGAAHPGPLDAFVWTDRGIYRPGETVHLQALLRDAAGLPADIPAQLTIRRPNGQVFQQSVPPRLGGAALSVPVTLSGRAAAGTWVAELRADPAAEPIGRTEFRVDAFVPDRMAVELGPLPPALAPGTVFPVTARFLYGAPGAGLSGHGYVTLNVDPAPFPGLPNTRFGLVDEPFAPVSAEAALPPTDAQGQTRYVPDFSRLPDTTRPLKADVMVEVDDPAGHGSRATASVPVRGTAPFVGIRPVFAGNEVDAGSEAAFDIVAVGPDGTPRAMAARLRLVRERPDWRLVVRGRLARYETVYRDEPLEMRDLALIPGAPAHFAKTLGFGRYRLEVSEAGGMAATSVRFRAGWADTESPDVPDRVDVSAATGSVRVGDVARIHVAAPFAGHATLAVLSDRVLALRTIDVPTGGTDVDVPVEAGWGPGAYVAVHVFRGAGGDGSRPARALGLTWVGVDPAARTLDVAIEGGDRLPPRATTAVVVRTAPGAWVSLAAVDEGILRLTRFATPDPAGHFLGRRRLGLDIRDDWGRLIAAADGTATLLRQGGDTGSFVLPDVPIRTVTLFAGPVQAGPDGRASIPLDMPDFAGEVRLMAVAWEGSRIGAASRAVVVRDPLVAEPLLPRFLAPGDTTQFGVLLHDLELPAGPVAMRLVAGGPLALPDGDALTTDIAAGGQKVVTTRLAATGAGRGTLRLEVTAGAFHVAHEVAITVRPARGPISVVAGRAIGPGETVALAPPPDRFVPGTARVQATWGAAVRYDVPALAAELAAYPLSCLEQLSSQALALASLPASEPGALGAAVAAILDRQRYDGGFALWSANERAEPWLSAYATDVLLRARDAGAAVPGAALAEALKFLAEAADSDPDEAADLSAQAYRLYVLARAGQGRAGAARVLAEQPDRLPTPLARAQLAAALAIAHDARAVPLFADVLAAPARAWWAADYGTALRDQAATATLLRESGLLPERAARLAAALPGPDLVPGSLSTQEQAWLVATGAALGRDGRPRVALDGIEQPVRADGTAATEVDRPRTARNLGNTPIWQSVSATGVPLDAPPASRHQMRVSRQFFALDGSALDLSHITQNTVFVLLLEGRAEDGQDHRAMLLQGLPAGWEAAGRVAGAGDTGIPDAMPWLGALTLPEAEPAADDRFAAVLALSGDKPGFRVAVRLRATTPGDYALPGAELADMYRPALFARQGENRIAVLPRE